MDKKRSSLIEEISTHIPKRHLSNWAETQADHVITASIRLLEEMSKVYNPEIIEKLERRLILSIKTRDPQKFQNTIRMLRGNNDGGTADE